LPISERFQAMAEGIWNSSPEDSAREPLLLRVKNAIVFL
jgi:hypothetical protein